MKTDGYNFVRKNGKNSILLSEITRAQRETERNIHMDEVKLCEQYLLTMQEASQYFRIGLNKIRNIIRENPGANFYLMNGTRILIKRKLFEEFINNATVL